MMMITFRFSAAVPTEACLRDRLRAELGPSKASDVDIEYGSGYGGNETDADVSLLSMDVIALVYAKKVCLALGGVRLREGREQRQAEGPDWARVSWFTHGLLTRLRIRLGTVHL